MIYLFFHQLRISSFQFQKAVVVGTTFLAFWYFSPVDLVAQAATMSDFGVKLMADTADNWKLPPVQEEGTSILDTSGTGMAQAEIYRTAEKERQKLLELIQARLALADLMVKLDQLDPSDERWAALNSKFGHATQIEQRLAAELLNTKKRLGFLQLHQGLPVPAFQQELADWEKNNQPPKAEFVDLRDHGAFGLLRPTHRHLDCEIRTDSTEPGLVRRSVSPAQLFSYTDSSLQAAFPNRDFISCMANLYADENGFKGLGMEIAVATPKAGAIFGLMPNETFVELVFIQGQSLKLYNRTMDNGAWDERLQAFVYRADFGIGSFEEKIFKNSELTRITVRWSKAQEAFEIYDLDFLSRQLACINGTNIHP